MVSVLSFVLLFTHPATGSGQSPSGKMPAAVRGVLFKAGVLIDKKEYRQAREILTTFQAKVSALDKDNPDFEIYHHAEIYFAIGTCLLFEKRLHDAVRNFQASVSRDPEQLNGWLNLAASAYELKEYSLAASSFASAYEKDPEKNPEHLYHSGVALMLNEEYERAVATFEQVFSLYPDKIKTCWRENMAHALLALDKPLLAVPHIEILIEDCDGQKKVKWQEILLYQYLQLEMKEKALEFALRLIEENPVQDKWWNALVRLYMEQGNYSLALSSLITLGHLKDLSSQEKRLMGDLYMQLGIPGSAIEYYRNIADDDSSQILPNMLVALQQTGKNEEALQLLNSYTRSVDKVDDKLLMQKGDLLFSLDRYSEAADCYGKVAYLDKKISKRAKEMEHYARLLADRESVQ